MYAPNGPGLRGRDHGDATDRLVLRGRTGRGSAVVGRASASQPPAWRDLARLYRHQQRAEGRRTLRKGEAAVVLVTEGGLTAVESRLAALETSNQALTTKVGALESKAASLETANGSLTSKVQALEQKSASLEAKTQALEGKVTTLESANSGFRVSSPASAEA